MEELQMLLENFWIMRSDRESFNKIRDSENRIRTFIEEKLGYRLIINPYIIKLEKVPGDAEEWMGIDAFQTPMDYAFLCLLMAFLEDKGPDDQFVLSSITEYIEAQYDGPDRVDWTLFQHRKSLVRVLNFAVDLGMIKVDDGNQERFSDSRDTEVLYENVGVSRYFVRAFNREVTHDMNVNDFIEDDFPLDSQDTVVQRRHRAYRKLLLSPVVYSEGPDDQDFMYIRNYRNTIAKDFEEYLGAKLHVHKTCAFIIYNDNKYLKSCFPDRNKNISDIMLQVCTVIREMILNGELAYNYDDTIDMTEAEFINIILGLKDRFSSGWYKSYREMSEKQLIQEVIENMESFKMIKRDENLHSVKILPMAAKLIGEYPADFIKS
ncbi:TIGR02678 family protein [Aceticella autotrophica]|uniref:TIGR02678 family protein n=1 Tax=Aceticella autotrophica TaxID=2755338 RepID=A0A975AXG9_9THEO|nr:TIGR02678 family protein [Aceticella autotrophica]